tara:strand:- start:367 stop:1212 length:846 start_codon:yes stop_codon:yes gene_type:complete
MSKKILIIQGGGFRTGFSAGVLDAFIAMDYNPFDSYIVVSGGSIAVSYYLGGQYGHCFNAMCLLAEDKEFMSYYRMFGEDGVMDVNYFKKVAETLIPFDMATAMKELKNKELSVVMTNKITGKPEYFKPDKNTWLDSIIASCTLPFVTKGTHQFNGKEFMDGGWSDPLPIEWAVKNGGTDITIIRTTPKDLKVTQSWTDYFASYAYRGNTELQSCHENNHKKYNQSIDFINSNPKNVTINQIAPDSPLMAGTYSNSVDVIKKDYHYGVQKGLDYIFQLKSK